jgi:class 3 adenylate cyclase/tetratricopeptide (TPR) repeat protein
VTALFCDLVGFTARAEGLDPEEVRAFVAPYQARLRAELERFGGTVEKFIGDAVMGLFGAPVAHEDDAERAVRAALAVRDWVLEEGEDLQVRIGINTGEALVSLGARPLEGEGMATGDVVNTAARLQAAAPIGGILVGEQTYRATWRTIDLRSVSDVVAKGKERPVRAWEAVQARSRYGVDLTERPVGPFVGRVRELALLETTLSRVIEERTPQLLTLVGVPGIGKSRLVAEFFRAVDGDPDVLVLWRQGRCLPYGEGVTFWALGEMVKAQAGVLESDPVAKVETKLDRAIRAVVPDDTEAGWIADSLRPLVGLESHMDLTAEHLDQTFAVWRRFLEALAEFRPLVLVFEDLHWADHALLDFVDQLVDWATGVPLLVLGTARPELLDRRPGWGGGKTNALSVSLASLPDQETADLVTALLDRSELEPEALAAVLARAGGNPLYAEQYAHLLVERGGLEELPGSIQGIIAARLDALSVEEKAMLQDASVLGKVFWLGALEALGGPRRWRAEDLLHGLERKGFVRRARRSSVTGEEEYAFQHILLRDVAYSQIPRRTRSEKHRSAAAWIESLGRVEDHAETIAHHYGEALEYAQASGTDDPDLRDRVWRSFRTAGERAMSLGAHAAAAGFFERTLELVPEDAPQRAELLAACGRARFFAEGTGTDLLAEAVDRLEASGDRERAAEVAVELARSFFFRGQRDRRDAYVDRALALTEGGPNSPARAKVLVARSAYLMLASAFGEAVDLARASLPVVEELGLGPERARLLDVIGISLASQGDAAGLHESERAVRAAIDAGYLFELIVATNNLYNGQVYLGRIDDAERTMDAFRDRVIRFGTLNNRRWLASNEAEISYVRGRWDDALSILDDDLARSERGFPFYLEPTQRSRRALIREARGDHAGALTDSERAAGLAGETKDPQLLAPVLVIRARIVAAGGPEREPSQLVSQVLEMGEVGIAGLQAECIGELLITLAWLAHDLDRAEEVLGAFGSAPRTPWLEAATEVLRGDPVAAADALGRLRSLAAEAYARLCAGRDLVERGRTAEGHEQLRKAAAFHRLVRATAFVREAEDLLRSPVKPAG